MQLYMNIKCNFIIKCAFALQLFIMKQLIHRVETMRCIKCNKICISGLTILIKSHPHIDFYLDSLSKFALRWTKWKLCWLSLYFWTVSSMASIQWVKRFFFTCLFSWIYVKKYFIVIWIEISILKNLTLEELAEVAGAFRKQCQTQVEVSDDLIDGINLGEFPKDHNLMVNRN